MNRRVSTAVLTFALVATSACGSDGSRAAGDTSTQAGTAVTNSVLQRCVDLGLPTLSDSLGIDLELEFSSVDTNLGLSCSFSGSDGMRVSLYQYGDDAKFRRDELEAFRGQPINGIGDGAALDPAHVYSNSFTAPEGTAEVWFDVATSRWKGIVTGKTDDLDRIDLVIRRVARQVAEASARFGPLVSSDVELAPAVREAVQADVRDLAEVLSAPTVPEPEPRLAYDPEFVGLTSSLKWSLDDPSRSVSVSLVEGGATPRTYVADLEAAEEASSYPLISSFEEVGGLGDEAYVSVTDAADSPNPDSAYSSYQYIVEREGRLYLLRLTGEGVGTLTESAALAFAKRFYEAGPSS